MNEMNCTMQLICNAIAQLLSFADAHLVASLPFAGRRNESARQYDTCALRSAFTTSKYNIVLYVLQHVFVYIPFIDYSFSIILHNMVEV